MITLKSDRLRVEIMEPGEHPNNGFRFDRSGYIADVILDNDIHFCASEPKNLVHPTSWGRGLCNEYRLDLSKEIQIGEYFPKFGIGLIRKEDDGKFIFYKQYKDIIPFKIDVEKSENAICFNTNPMPCMGYALACKKTISLEDTELFMDLEVENVGEKEVNLQEFCHNFLSIDGMAVGSDYVLELPQIPDQGKKRMNSRRGFSGSFRGAGKGFTFCEFTAIDTDLQVDASSVDKTHPFSWNLYHKGAGAQVYGEVSFTPGEIDIWGVDHVISPEIVNYVNIKPSETKKWRYKWRFDMFK